MTLRTTTTTLAALLTLIAITNVNAQDAHTNRIPLFSTEHIGRQGFVHVGGEYVEHEDEHYMQGSMYVDVWEPREISRPYPIVFLHGAGQTATYWQQTPDGRPGWAYYLLEQGYTVFMPDFPARGRSIYVPGVDRDLTMRSAERICCSTTAAYTNGDEFGEWPRHERVSQWPGEGMMGDPVFDASVLQNAGRVHGRQRCNHPRRLHCITGPHRQPRRSRRTFAGRRHCLGRGRCETRSRRGHRRDRAQRPADAGRQPHRYHWS